MKFPPKPLNAPGKPIQSIEMLRGIASFMVLLFHLTNNPVYLPANSALRGAGRWGWTGVEIFFIISGFVIPYAMYGKGYTLRDFPKFFKKRIIRIEPPYLLSIVLVLVLNYVSTLSPYYRGAPFSVDWKNVLGHVAYLNVFTGGTWLSPVYWSLAIEFQYYLIIALAFLWVSSSKRVYRLTFYVLFAGSAFLLGSGSFIFTFSGYFLIGILLFQFFSGIIGRGEFLAMQVVSLGFVCYRFGWVLMAISLVTVLAILFVRKVPRPLLYLGTISYSLYLIHVPVGGRIINISEVLIKNPLLREVMVVVTIAVCLVVAAIYYRVVEKYFRQAAGAIRYERPVAAGEPLEELIEEPIVS
jgi:peptidoglycan/LPS O-acetylase OafA/YrhL